MHRGAIHAAGHRGVDPLPQVTEFRRDLKKLHTQTRAVPVDRAEDVRDFQGANFPTVVAHARVRSLKASLEHLRHRVETKYCVGEQPPEKLDVDAEFGVGHQKGLEPLLRSLRGAYDGLLQRWKASYKKSKRIESEQEEFEQDQADVQELLEKEAEAESLKQEAAAAEAAEEDQRTSQKCRRPQAKTRNSSA